MIAFIIKRFFWLLVTCGRSSPFVHLVRASGGRSIAKRSSPKSAEPRTPLQPDKVLVYGLELQRLSNLHANIADASVNCHSARSPHFRGPRYSGNDFAVNWRPGRRRRRDAQPLECPRLAAKGISAPNFVVAHLHPRSSSDSAPPSGVG
jgi:hypothetical protein